MYDLRPFIVGYMFFVQLFVVMYSVMDTEVDEELLTPGSLESIGSYGLMIVAVWRNSVGKLGYPCYKNIIKLSKN